MANNPREFPKKESPLVRWYLNKYPGSAIVRPSGAVRLNPDPITPEPPEPPVDPCEGVVCPDGYICVNGICVEDSVTPPVDPCEGVVCPDGSTCQDGVCIPTNMLFNKESMVATFDAAADAFGADPKFKEAFARAIDRWHAILSYPDFLTKNLKTSTNPNIEPYKNGIIFHLEDIKWAPGGLVDTNDPVPSIHFVDRDDVTIAAAANVQAKVSKSSQPEGSASRRGQIALSGGMIVNVGGTVGRKGSVDFWEITLMHELCHWLGINSDWGDQFVDQTQLAITSGYPYALGGFNYYQSSLQQTIIPLEDTGGTGTVGGHWENETRLGIRNITNELMNGSSTLNQKPDGSLTAEPQVASLLTMGALADYGYKILGHESGATLSSLRQTGPRMSYGCHLKLDPSSAPKEIKL